MFSCAGSSIITVAGTLPRAATSLLSLFLATKTINIKIRLRTFPPPASNLARSSSAHRRWASPACQPIALVRRRGGSPPAPPSNRDKDQEHKQSAGPSLGSRPRSPGGLPRPAGAPRSLHGEAAAAAGGFPPTPPRRSSGCGPAPRRPPKPLRAPGGCGSEGQRRTASGGRRAPAAGCPRRIPCPAPSPVPAFANLVGGSLLARSAAGRERGGQRLAPPASPLRPRCGRSPRRAGLGAAARAEVRFPPLFALTAAKSGRKTPRLR